MAKDIQKPNVIKQSYQFSTLLLKVSQLCENCFPISITNIFSNLSFHILVQRHKNSPNFNPCGYNLQSLFKGEDLTCLSQLEESQGVQACLCAREILEIQQYTPRCKLMAINISGIPLTPPHPSKRFFEGNHIHFGHCTIGRTNQ